MKSMKKSVSEQLLVLAMVCVEIGYLKVRSCWFVHHFVKDTAGPPPGPPAGSPTEPEECKDFLALKNLVAALGLDCNAIWLLFQTIGWA